MQIVGIGDLHLDSPLSQYIPSLNSVVLDEVRTALAWASKRHIDSVILYGDIGHKPALSYDATCKLIELFVEFSHMKFVVVKGNHDTKSCSENSLQVLQTLQTTGLLKNVCIVADAPKVLFQKTDTPINVLPWPFCKTHRDVLNVLHTEVAGAKWDTGREVKTEHDVNTKHLSVIGHIHTAQTVGNAHFSGTLYQTNFGESPEKFFHHIHWTGNPKSSKVKLIPHVPKYKLLNVVVNDKRDLKTIPDDPNTLVKVFVNKDVILPFDVFDNRPNVVKFNNFGTKAELQVLIHDEFSVEDLSGELKLDIDTMLTQWMQTNNVERHIQKRVPVVLNKLLTER